MKKTLCYLVHSRKDQQLSILKVIRELLFYDYNSKFLVFYLKILHPEERVILTWKTAKEIMEEKIRQVEKSFIDIWMITSLVRIRRLQQDEKSARILKRQSHSWRNYAWRRRRFSNYAQKYDGSFEMYLLENLINIIREVVEIRDHYDPHVIWLS